MSTPKTNDDAPNAVDQMALERATGLNATLTTQLDVKTREMQELEARVAEAEGRAIASDQKAAQALVQIADLRHERDALLGSLHDRLGTLTPAALAEERTQQIDAVLQAWKWARSERPTIAPYLGRAWERLIQLAHTATPGRDY